eukprot:3725531-Prorocentrum_lima.AAC.1
MAKADIPPLQSGKDPWQHVIDACTRYTQANIVTNRTTKAFLPGLQEIWIAPFGPPRIIETDHE